MSATLTTVPVRKEIFFYWKKHENIELSNFYPCTIVIDYKIWPSTEHYYQAMKTLDPALQEFVRGAPTPYYAKAVMQKGVMKDKDLRPDWDDVKVGVMKKAIRAKFTQHKKLMHLLLDTEDAGLHEDSDTDLFWGCVKDKDGKFHGQDMLGKLLMELREEIRKEIAWKR